MGEHFVEECKRRDLKFNEDKSKLHHLHGEEGLISQVLQEMTQLDQVLI